MDCVRLGAGCRRKVRMGFQLPWHTLRQRIALDAQALTPHHIRALFSFGIYRGLGSTLCPSLHV